MKRTTLIFIVIMCLASALRLVNISINPPSIYWEEAALGYDAYSILKTAHDYHGNFLPILAFPSFGDFKPSLYFYTIVPLLAIVGQSTLAIRLPSALAGIVTVWLVFLLGKRMKDERFGLLAAFIFAIQPWSVHLSRIGFEANLAVMFITAGVLCLVESRKKPWFMVLSSFFFVLSMYTYHADRIVAPLLAITIGLGLGLLKNMRVVGVAVLLAVICMLPIIVNIKNPVIAQRAAETSIFSGTSLIEKSNALRDADGNTLFTRIIHHRFIVMGETVTLQYFRNFSPIFLFYSGDENIRHTNGMNGVLYVWELLSVSIGVYMLFRMKNGNIVRVVLFPWILISAIPAALTTVSPHALRFVSAAPACALLSAWGVMSLVDVAPKKFRLIVWMIFASLVVVFGIAFLHAEFVLYPKTSAKEWQYGYKELVESVEKLRKPSQKVFVTREQGRPSMYFLWYTHQNPAEIQKMDKELKKDQQELLEFGPYIFGDRIPSDKEILVAASPQHTPKNVQILQKISLPSGKVIWNIWEQ